jgi:hypothetical protein
MTERNRRFRTEDEAPQFVKRLSNKAKVDMLTMLLRSDAAFSAVEESLSAEALTEWHRGRGLVFSLTRKHFRKHHVLPSKVRLESLVEKYLNEHPGYLTKRKQDDVSQLLETAFGLKRSAVDGDFAVETAKQFMRERATEQLRQQVIDEDDIPIDLPAILAEINQQVERVDAIGSDHDGPIFPKGWDAEEKIPKRPTGNEALDFFLGGGDSEGQVNIFMGPYGTCKCLGKGTPILMFDGTVKPVEDVVVGDLVVGDLLMGPDSTPRRVTALGRGREMLYRVIPTKGESYVVNESHILSLKRSPRFAGDAHKLVNIEVRDWL